MLTTLVAAAMLAADTNHFVVCPTLPQTTDTTSQTIYGRVSDPFTRLALPPGFSGIVAEAVRAKMTIPATLPANVFAAGGQPTIATTAAFSLMPNGDAQHVVAMASSSSLAIDSMLIIGIERAAKDSSFPPLPPHAGNGIRLALTLSTDSGADAIPMFSTHLPAWRGFVPARALPNNTRPRSMNTPVRGESDTLTVSIIVDEKGVPLLGTAHILHAPSRAITLAYLEWFRESRFVPAHIQQCAVRSLIELKGTMTFEDKFLPAPS
jgi:hypothetical protein